MNLNHSYPMGQAFPGSIGETVARSSQAWPVPPRQPANAPNVVMVVLDDVGFGQIGCFGGLGGRIRTPHMDRLASGGLRYNNFHVTALCSPTRAALMTGRNHHSVGVGTIMERSTGFPGYNGQVPKEAAMVSTVLRDQGFCTMALGKWHLTPHSDLTAIGPYNRWPLGQGFDRFYGFLGGEADQWNPILHEDNHRVATPGVDGQEYHLTPDLVDHAIEWIAERKAIAPSKPFFLHLAFGAGHSPHHAPKEWVDGYRGAFDAGWDVIRDQTLEVQKNLGIVPASTQLPERNTGVQPWEDLTQDQRRLFARQMEVFAGFLSHTDHHLGRFISSLEESGALENTVFMLVSDNGASAEGGTNGLASETSYFNGVSESVESMLEQIENWGDPSTFPHYSNGWAMAGNTPNRLYKGFLHEGGTHTPLIVHWPAGITDPGSVRRQFHSAVDIVPTILETVNVEMPEVVDGYAQQPIQGVSMAYSFTNPDEATRRESQYFEMHGHRAMWKDGWKAVTFHWCQAVQARLGQVDHQMHDGDFDADLWELYHLDEDVSETNDLAREHPEKLAELVDLWWAEIADMNVLPLDDRGVAARGLFNGPVPLEEREAYTYFGHMELDWHATPGILNRSHSLIAQALIDDPRAGGPILSNGGPDGGYTICIVDGRVHYASNYLGREYFVLADPEPLAPGRLTVRLDFVKTGEHRGTATLLVNGRAVDEQEVARTNPVTYGTRSRGLRTGSDRLTVWPGAPAPATLAGSVDRVDIVCVGAEHRDLEAEARVAMHRQ